MVCYSFLDSEVIGKRYLKFPFDIRELPYKLRIGKVTDWQNSIFASLSDRQLVLFKDAIESIIKGCSSANKIEHDGVTYLND